MSPPSGGLGRAEALLDGAAAATADDDRGYIDLLGDDDAPESTGAAQSLRTTGFVPVVYERWWRPALGRAVKGLTGPGMDEEVRIARLLLGLSLIHI